MKLCLACFKKCEDNALSCPHCGYGSDSFVHPTAALPVGTLLQDRIITGKAKISDGKIIYNAFDKLTKESFSLIAFPQKENVKEKDSAEVFCENGIVYRISRPETASAVSPKKKSKKSKANKIFKHIAYASSIICLLLSVSYLVHYYILEPWRHDESVDEQQEMLNNTFTTVAGVDPLKEIRKKYPDIYFPDGMNPNFVDLYVLNQEFAGQIKIDGIYSEDKPLDFAVMQTNNNDKYLKTDYKGESNKYGQPYFDYRNSLKTLDRNTIIHGHNMNYDDKVFGGLEQYRDPETFKKSPIIEMKTLYGDYKFKIYAVIIVNGDPAHDNGKRFYYNFTKATDDEFAKYIEELDKRKLYSTGVDICPQDKIITLSTCCYDFKDARLAVIGRLVRDGESTEVDTSLVTVNKNPKFPQISYDSQGKSNPYKNDEHLFMVP